MLKPSLKNKFSLSFKLLLISLLALANLQLLEFSTVMAQGAPAAKTSDGIQTDRNNYASFDVSKYLTVNNTGATTGSQDQSYLKSSNPVASFILQIINLITLMAASLSFLAVVVGGFFMMSAAGNETQINKGKDIATRAIVGLVLTLSSYFIISFVQNIFFETAPK